MNAKLFFVLIYCIVLPIAWFCTVNAAVCPSTIKGLATCFNDVRLSPLQGAILWESGVVKNYYDLGVLSPSSSSRWLNHPDGPVRLARALFTANAGNFDVSNHANYPAFHMAPSTVTNCMLFLEHSLACGTRMQAVDLEDVILRDPAFAQSVASKQKEHQVKVQFYERQMQHAALPIKKYLQDSCRVAHNACDTQRLCRNWLRRQKIKAMKDRMAIIDKLSGREKQCVQKEHAQLVNRIEKMGGSSAGGDYNRVYELAQAVIDSVKTCNHYPESIAQWLLLAFMYRKASSKHDLAEYINMLASNLVPAPCRSVDALWTVGAYSVHDLASIKSRINDHLEYTYIVPASSIHEDYAYTHIIQNFYAGALPKIAEYKTVSFCGHSFSNCAETTLRNFCNIVLYDRDQGIFDLSKVPRNHISQELQTYYAESLNASAINVQLPEVHQAWSELLCHQPLITYRTAITRSSTEQDMVLRAPPDSEGFIFGLPEQGLQKHPIYADRVIIGGRSYVVVDPEKVRLCEMHPTIRNIIISIDRLFDLGLFVHKDVAQEFLRPGFNAFYMPRLCALFDQLKDRVWTQAQLDELNTHDYTKRGLELNFQHFDLILNHEHAEIVPRRDRHSKTNISSFLLRLSRERHDQADSTGSSSSRELQQLAPLLAVQAIMANQLPPGVAYQHLLFLNVAEPYAKIELIVYCLQEAQKSPEADKLIELAATQLFLLPERLDWMYHCVLLSRLTNTQLRYSRIRHVLNNIVDRAMSLINEPIEKRSHVPLLFRELVRKRCYYDQAIIVVRNLIISDDVKERRRALRLLAELMIQSSVKSYRCNIKS